MDLKKQAWRYIITNGTHKKKPVDVGHWIVWVIVCIIVVGILYLISK